MSNFAQTEIKDVLEYLQKFAQIKFRFDWEFADLLLDKCGEPSEQLLSIPDGLNINDKAIVRIGGERSIKELYLQIFEVCPDHDIIKKFQWWLVHYKCAYWFPKETRINGISFWTHYDAGNPETLNAIIEVAKRENKRITGDYVREVRRRSLEQVVDILIEENKKDTNKFLASIEQEPEPVLLQPESEPALLQLEPEPTPPIYDIIHGLEEMYFEAAQISLKCAEWNNSFDDTIWERIDHAAWQLEETMQEIRKLRRIK